MSENYYKAKITEPSQLTPLYRDTLLVLTTNDGKMVGYMTSDSACLNSGYKLHKYDVPVSVRDSDKGLIIKTKNSKITYKH